MIILTGMDNTGKTTFAKTISNKFSLPIVKSIGPDATQDEKDLWFIDQLTRENNLPNSVIHDRFLPFEEMVYGKVLRGFSAYTLDHPLMKKLKRMAPHIVYTRPPSKSIFNFGEREQMKGVIEKDKELLAAWDDLIFTLISQDWDITIYDYTMENKENKNNKED